MNEDNGKAKTILKTQQKQKSTAKLGGWKKPAKKLRHKHKARRTPATQNPTHRALIYSVASLPAFSPATCRHAFFFFFFPFFLSLLGYGCAAQRSINLNTHSMHNPQINCYQARTACLQSFTFYILSKGNHAGKPCFQPWVNCFTVTCKCRESLDYYFWLTYSLWQSGKFKPYHRGSVIPFVSIKDVRSLINEVAPVIQPHWQHYQQTIGQFNKLQTLKSHLSQQIIAAGKLQEYLLSIYF
jgi:hypothetical protein